jgi:hypothetical protein
MTDHTAPDPARVDESAEHDGGSGLTEHTKARIANLAEAAAKKAKGVALTGAVNKATKELIGSGYFASIEAEARRAVFSEFGIDAADVDGEQDGEEDPELVYGSADEFLREYLIPLFHRRVSGKGDYRWAAEWWHSAEAIARIEALWRAWEFLRLSPATGMSVWLKDHADYHMGVLLSSDGAFALSDDTNQLGQPLPHQSAPEGLFPDQREAAGS